MVIAQKPWDTVEAELEAYRARFVELNDEEPTKPILCVFVCVNGDAAEARRMRNVYLQRYAESVVEHYGFANPDFAHVEGYEYYANLAKQIEKHGVERFCSFLADLQIVGTPDQVTDKICDYVDRLNAGAVLTCLSFGGMPPDVAKANYELFAREVLPNLLAYDVGGDIGVSYGATVRRAPRPMTSGNGANSDFRAVI
jgi:alkanesulfonate monooxygenase SsuD/methylene tetrahydromethanopterin reductase-like flavin-dependent oxidoreductase (luciferase family)